MLVAIGALLAAVAAPLPTERPRLHVDMQVEQGVLLAADQLRAVAAQVERIWEPLLDVAVSVPGSPRPAGAADAVRLVLTNRRLASGEGGLGWIEFVGGEPRREITVSVSAVDELVTRGAWRGRLFTSLPQAVGRTFIQRALSRTIAHEMGHYLLRSPSHQPRGLMRAVFTVDEIMEANPALGKAERTVIAQLRQGELLARAGRESR